MTRVKKNVCVFDNNFASHTFSHFPFRIWIVAVSVIVVTFAIIGFGISLLLDKNCDHGRRNSSCEVRQGSTTAVN